MKKISIIVAILTLNSGFGVLNSFSQNIDTAQVSLNYSNTQGAFNDYLFSTVAGPYSDPNAAALSRQARFKFVETGFEMPIPLNANDSTQYNFSALDLVVNEIVNQGMEPYIVFQQPLIQPTILADYATYIKNVIRHYTQGWNNGYYYTLKAVRLGNEPDGTGFWQGTQQQFFDTYAAASNAIKSLDSTIIIDAFGVSVAAGWVGNTRLLNPWITNFLSYCQTNNVKVDIFTFHAYNPIVYYPFYSDLTLINNELSGYPTLSNIFGTPKLGNNEWNTDYGGTLVGGPYAYEFDSAWVAAHNILALSAMISQSLSLSIRYGGTYNSPAPNCQDFVLTDCNSNGKPAYFAFKGFNMLAGDSIVQTTGSDYMNFSAISGKTTDTITLILSNFDALTYLNRFESDTLIASWIDYNKYVAAFGTPAVYEYAHIAVNNLSWSGDSIKVLHYLVDDNNDLNLINTSAFGGTSNLSFVAALSAPSVHVFKIFKETVTGIEVQPGQNNYVNIFPSPSSGKFTIEMLNTNNRIQNGNIEIYNVFGECIYKSLILNPKSLIDISAQPNGMYFYKVTNEQRLIGTGKIVIQ